MKKSQHQKISACLIVKNEEELLPNCLSSIKNTVDEIIIVDTGSTDSTVTIAKDLALKSIITRGMTASARQEIIA